MIAVLRKLSIAEKNRKKTHCPKGHDYSLDRRGRRICRECERIRQRLATRRKISVCVYFEPEEFAEVNAIAKTNRLSRSEAILRLIERGLRK